ncbi:hypothetical protein ONZ45_g16383 [Pleurotus djamor]|nr:hypothetical protein ONZ45_g16383 [Pleurotus djamor]
MELTTFHKDVSPVSWDASTISSSQSLFTNYASLHTEQGLLDAITQLTQYGLLFVRGVPNEETSHETCELPALANKFGPIRETFYGKTWDVMNVKNSKNIAYTNLYLGLHMDLLYMQHPPRYQILHCLRNRVQGGESLFTDALHAAQVLRETSPADFEVLATTPVAFHYINDGHHLHREHPTIQLGGTPSTPFADRPIDHINYSPPFQAPLPIHSTPSEFYPALKNFVGLLEKPSSEYRYLLREGDAVLFDNRRVLHARTSFEDVNGKEGETNRWLKGCYLEADAILDTGRVLRAKLAGAQ